MHRSPGSHVAIVGAGMSVDSGLPSGWQVEEQLIGEVAAQRGTDLGGTTPHKWWQATFGEPATYQRLLGKLAPTPVERQRLLRPYFEGGWNPDHGEVAPSGAHRALAELVRSGAIRIVITLNFDRLIERALTDIGINPLVASSPEQLRALPPVHSIPALVIHLHGDYLEPETMRNTAGELDGYPDEVRRVVGRILGEYGLVIVGWSAAYDPALREMIDTCERPPFTSCWIDPYPLKPVADELRARRGLGLVVADANEALGTLRASVEALAERTPRHPLSAAALVAMAKRELIEQRTPVRLHDRLRSEFARLWALPAMNPTQFDRPANGQGFPSAVSGLMAETVNACAMVATCAYWGDSATESWWMPEIARLAAPRRGSGLTALIRLPNLPSSLVVYAAGVAAVAAGRHELVYRVLTEPRVRDPYRGTYEPAAQLHRWEDWFEAAGSSVAMDALGPAIGDDLAIGRRAYSEAWETFEILRLAEFTARQGISDVVAALLNWVRAETQSLQGLVDEAAVEEAKLSYRLVVARTDSHWGGTPHVRVQDGIRRGGHPPVVSGPLLDGLWVQRSGHSLPQAGFCGGSWEGAYAAVDIVTEQLGALGHEQAFRLMAGRDGFVPDYFWLDTGVRPSD